MTNTELRETLSIAQVIQEGLKRKNALYLEVPEDVVDDAFAPFHKLAKMLIDRADDVEWAELIEANLLGT